MSDKPDAREELRRYLRQRIEAGESVHLAPTTLDAGGSDRPQAARLDTFADAGSAAASSGQKHFDPQVSPGSAAGLEAVKDSIESIADEVRACTRCRLHETRTKAVPGVGPTDADLVFIGEGPGADEDAQGEPFVGRAGQLLTKIIESVELRREQVFITNIVKCRPPNNRDPRPDEIAACEPFLQRQLAVLAPKVICALGRHAAMTLLQTNESMASLRTGERSYAGIRVFPTYHPAALLRNSQWKRPVWEDIQKVRRAYDEPLEKR